MFSISKDARIFLHGKPVDLRNGFDGLSFLAHSAFKDEMIPNTYFVFINSRRTLIKVLFWSGNNLHIWYLRLRKGVFFPPYNLSNKKINFCDLNLMLNGQTPKHLFCP